MSPENDVITIIRYVGRLGAIPIVPATRLIEDLCFVDAERSSRDWEEMQRE